MLQYAFCISENTDTKGLSLIDNTGVFSLTNKSGYGVPNALLSEVSTATLTVTFPNPLTTPVTLNVFDLVLPYPNITNLPKNISNVMLGLALTKKLDDGVYLFSGTLTGISSLTPFTTTYSFYQVLDNQVQAFFDSRIQGLKVPDCACDCPPDKESYKLERLKNLLRAAKAAACNGQIDNAKNIMDYLIKIANCNNGPLTLC